MVSLGTMLKAAGRKPLIILGLMLQAGLIRWSTPLALAEGSPRLDASLETRIEMLAEDVWTSGNEIEALISGDEFRPARLEAIESATRTIDLITYIWKDDESGLLFAEALAARSREGVRVRVIGDYLSGYDWSRSTKIMQDAGVHVLVFNKPIGLLDIERRVHEKVMVVDGAYAFVGGINIANEYMHVGNDPRGYWDDFDATIAGPVSARIQARFDWTWNKMVWEATLDKADAWKKTPYFKDPTPSTSPDRRAGDSRALYLYQQPYYSKHQGRKFEELHELLLRSAGDRIVAFIPYLVPPKSFLSALKDQAESGVRVQVITNSPELSDMPGFLEVSDADYYSQLLDSGVEVYEVTDRMLHGKALLIDTDWLVLGSHNFTQGSFRRNGEAAILTDDESAILKMSRFGEELVASSAPVTRDLIAERTQGTRSKLRLLIAKLLRRFF